MADESANELTNNQPPLENPHPQLRLHHVFALTAVAAVLLALHGPQQDYWSEADIEPSGIVQSAYMVLGVVYVLLAAVAITALAYGIVWQRMGLKFFSQPGHWLVVEIAITSLFAMVPAIVYRWMFSSMNNGDMEFSMLAAMFVGLYSLIFLFALPIGLNIYFGRKKCGETRWSLVLYMKAVSKVLFGLGELIVIALLMIAARRDRQEQVSRDASHWCGVWVQLTMSGLSCLSAGVTVVNMTEVFAKT